MKYKLLVVVLMLAVLSTFIVIGAQAFVHDKLAKSSDAAVQLVYTDSASDTAGIAFQVAWQSGIRKLRFRRI